MEKETALVKEASEEKKKSSSNPLSFKNKTPGERKFDLGVYGGIGWVANAAVSIPIAYFFDPELNKGSKNVKASLGTVISTLLLMSGGFIVLPFMKWMEDRKEKLVQKMDENHAKKHHLPMPEKDSTEGKWPKQSWGSIVSGRLAGLAVVIPASYVLSKQINDLGTFIASKIQQKPFADVKDTRTKHLSKLLVIEIGGSLLCAAVLFVSSKFIALIRDKKGAPDTLPPKVEATLPQTKNDSTQEDFPESESSKRHQERVERTRNQQSEMSYQL